MKRVKNFKVKLVGGMAIVAMLVVGVFTPNIIKRVNAATPGYFNDYDHDDTKSGEVIIPYICLLELINMPFFDNEQKRILNK